MFFRKYKNKKKIEEMYKNGIDIECVLPSVKKFMINTEFYLLQHMEKNRIEAIEQQRDLELETRIPNMVRESILKTLIDMGRLIQ